MRKIQLTENAQHRIQSEFDKKEFIALQLMAQEGIAKGFQTQFISSMQNLICKVGIILSQIIANGPKLSSCTCFGAIKYFSAILDDNKIENTLNALEINNEGNSLKHSLKSLNINIPLIVATYNSILDQLAQKLGVMQLKKGKLKPKSNINKQNISIFDPANKNSVKYESIAGNNIQLRLSPQYKVDLYNRQAQVTLTFFWEKRSTDTAKILISAISKNNSERCLSKKQIELNSTKTNEPFNLRLQENEIFDTNTVKLKVTIEIWRNKEVTKTKQVAVTTGKLFWKKTEYIDETYKATSFKKVASKEIMLTQKLREQKS